MSLTIKDPENPGNYKRPGIHFNRFPDPKNQKTQYQNVYSDNFVNRCFSKTSIQNLS